jgi:hypothetical protein
VSGDDKYKRRIKKGLDRAFDAKATEVVSASVDDLRLVVFSDHHKGGRDGADDFRRCERAYNAALAYYFELGYQLYLLGDAEELWECDAGKVLGSYPRTLELELAFHDAGRLQRFWGNHDDQWSRPKAVARHLAAFEGLRVREALKVEVTGDESGLLFFAHGHQGTPDSDRWGWLSRLPVRFIWAPIQRFTKIASTTPSKDWELRERHDAAMFAWACGHPERPILIAGHTHRPVFRNEKPQPKTAAGEPADDALARALEEWNLAEQRRVDPPAIDVDPPCYFNTGCCSFGDGDITGLEIADGQIRLVRWPDDDHKPVRKALASAELPEILSSVRAGASRLAIA